MRKKTVAIPDWAAEILRNQCTPDRCALDINAQLSRETYAALDKILKALGGKWDRKAKAHLFPSDAKALIDEALANGHAIDKKKTFEQFDTPPDLAAVMVGMADVEPGDSILEPSAGSGNLIFAAIERAYAVRVKAYELDPARCAALRQTLDDHGAPQCEVIEGDFLRAGDIGYHDVVLMNPPFSKNQDLEHVRHAWTCLRPGGRLAAITSPHWRFAKDIPSAGFRVWIEGIGAEVTENPAGAFAASGTGVNSILITATKTFDQLSRRRL